MKTKPKPPTVLYTVYHPANVIRPKPGLSVTEAAREILRFEGRGFAVCANADEAGWYCLYRTARPRRWPATVSHFVRADDKDGAWQQIAHAIVAECGGPLEAMRDDAFAALESLKGRASA